MSCKNAQGRDHIQLKPPKNVISGTGKCLGNGLGFHKSVCLWARHDMKLKLFIQSFGIL